LDYVNNIILMIASGEVRGDSLAVWKKRMWPSLSNFYRIILGFIPPDVGPYDQLSLKFKRVKMKDQFVFKKIPLVFSRCRTHFIDRQ